MCIKTSHYHSGLFETVVNSYGTLFCINIIELEELGLLGFDVSLLGHWRPLFQRNILALSSMVRFPAVQCHI